MDKRKITKGSKRLSWLLRFGAGEAGLTMDEAGWVSVKDALRAARLQMGELEQIVRQNDKQRFELDGERIRACQGHGKALPVTRDALEATWSEFEGPDVIWHGTHPSAVEGIAAQGILAIDRTHVHLAESKESRLGKRSGVSLMLQVSVARLREQGLRVFASPNGVVLVRHVPPDCIVGLVPVSRRATKQADTLKELLGLGG